MRASIPAVIYSEIARAIRGEIVSFERAPTHERDESCLVHLRDGLVLIGHDGRITSLQAWSPSLAAALTQAGVLVDDHSGCLVMPGFVDTHVHYAQLGVIASYGTTLLEWLERYTFPEERRFEDPEYCQAVASLFLDSLLANGTTTAAIWPTVHKTSVDALFEQARARNMRVACGKIMMDVNCPSYLIENLASCEKACADLISTWHGQGRLSYAVTPRFAATSSKKQLELAGKLYAEHPGVLMQTHLAETQDEVRWIASLFPLARSYLDVYARAGLLGERAVFAHGIWLDDEDTKALKDSGASLAHCPSSNLFLGSGLFDMARFSQAGIPVGFASDVGGGTSLSMLRTMSDAYKVQAMRGARLSPFAMFHASTLGGAQALGMDNVIGKLAPGYEADIVVLRKSTDAMEQFRVEKADTLFETLFAVGIQASKENVASVYIHGQPRIISGVV